MARSRTIAAVCAALASAWLARCTFDGLDAYDTGDARADASSDALQDSSSSDAADAGCNCAPAETCVLGKCETCLTTWTLDYPTGVSLSGELLDSPSNVLYVTGSRAVGDAGATSGYLGLVDACMGTLIKAFDAPMFGAQSIPGLSDPGLVAGKLYLHAYSPIGVPGGYVRFDVATRTFDGMLSPLMKFSTGQDETWQMAVGAGSVWFSGDQAYDKVDAALPVIVKSDGNGAYCSSPLAIQTGDERAGRGITVSGNDVYQFATSGSAVLRHFDASQCTLQPCVCTPTWTSSAYTITGLFMGAFRSVVVGQKVYFGGAVGVSADLTDIEGFASYYDLSTSKFTTAPYLYNPTSMQDGFLWLTTDGTQLYAGGGKSMVNLDFTTAQGVVVVLDLSLNALATVPTLSLKPSGGVTPIAGGFVISGMNATNVAASRTERCTMQQCP